MAGNLCKNTGDEQTSGHNSGGFAGNDDARFDEVGLVGGGNRRVSSGSGIGWMAPAEMSGMAEEFGGCLLLSASGGRFRD